MNHAALEAYGSTNLHSGLTDAPPEKLIQMLLDGSTTRLNSAVAAMQANEVARKGELISKSISILEYLKVILDEESAPEFAENLASLYDYMVSQLLRANVENDPEPVREVVTLLAELRAGWSAVSKESFQE